MAEEEKKEGVQMMEMQAIIRLLKTTAERAEHLRMTGGTEQGSVAAVRQYNAVLKRIKGFVFADPELFAPLEEDASFVDLAISCEQLAAYLEGMMEAAEPRPKKPPTQIMGPVSIKISDPGELGDLGELIRQAMPSWVKGQMGVDVTLGEAKRNQISPRYIIRGTIIQCDISKENNYEFYIYRFLKIE